MTTATDLKNQVLYGRVPFKHQSKIYDSYCRASLLLMTDLADLHPYIPNEVCEGVKFVRDNDHNTFGVFIDMGGDIADFVYFIEEARVVIGLCDKHTGKERTASSEDRVPLARLFRQLITVHANIMTTSE